MILCPRCGTASPPHLRAHEVNKRSAEPCFVYHRCPACRVLFLHPIPSSLGDYYPPEYYEFPVVIDMDLPRFKLARSRVETVQAHLLKGRLLEIGAGTGEFAALMMQAGYDVDAIEMDEACSRYLREVIGVQSIQSNDPLHALNSLGHYDVIAMWHVIEHLVDPWKFLDALNDHTSAGSILVIATPNPDSLQFKLFRRFWFQLDPPRHLELIPEKTLTSTMTALGWDRASLTTSDYGAYVTNYIGWQLSLSNVFGYPAVMSWVGAGLRRVLKPLETRGMFGSSYTVVYRRTA